MTTLRDENMKESKPSDWLDKLEARWNEGTSDGIQTMLPDEWSEMFSEIRKGHEADLDLITDANDILCQQVEQLKSDLEVARKQYESDGKLLVERHDEIQKLRKELAEAKKERIKCECGTEVVFDEATCPNCDMTYHTEKGSRKLAQLIDECVAKKVEKLEKELKEANKTIELYLIKGTEKKEAGS